MNELQDLIEENNSLRHIIEGQDERIRLLIMEVAEMKARAMHGMPMVKQINPNAGIEPVFTRGRWTP